MHRGVVQEVDCLGHELGRGKCPHHHWFVNVQSTGDGLRGSERVVSVRGLSGVGEAFEDLLEVRGSEGSSKQVFMRRGGTRVKNVFNSRGGWRGHEREVNELIACFCISYMYNCFWASFLELLYHAICHQLISVKPLVV